MDSAATSVIGNVVNYNESEKNIKTILDYAEKDKFPITLITSNPDKIWEFNSLINNHPELKEKYELFAEDFYDLKEPIQSTSAKIAADKAKNALHKTEYGTAVLVDDESLEIKALNGMPGPYIKHFIESVGDQGLVNMMSNYSNK